MITDTYVLIDAIKKSYPVYQFFKDRYFPDGRSYYSEKALIETKKQGRKIAPFVIPVVGGIPMEAEGYRSYEVKAPYIAPKMTITADDLAKKAFGEAPDSGRSPADRENEVEAEHMDDLRNAILRRLEKMAVDVITTGKIEIKSYGTANDAANDTNFTTDYLQYYENEFKNKWLFTKAFTSMTTAERIMEFYKMAAVLRKRGVAATDIVMTADVSMLLMTDITFLEYYNKKDVNTGVIDQKTLPQGVAFNGTINVNGVVMNMFTYDCEFEDLDGTISPFLPAGTIIFIQPGMGTTVYSQVTFATAGSGFESHAEKIVPRLVIDERNNLVEVQTFSRPVPYPKDVDSWLVGNIYADPVSQSTADNAVDTHEPETEGVTLKTEAEINAYTNKADLITYAEAIGLSGLSVKQSLEDIKRAILKYQDEIYGD